MRRTSAVILRHSLLWWAFPRRVVHHCSCGSFNDFSYWPNLVIFDHYDQKMVMDETNAVVTSKLIQHFSLIDTYEKDQCSNFETFSVVVGFSTTSCTSLQLWLLQWLLQYWPNLVILDHYDQKMEMDEMNAVVTLKLIQHFSLIDTYEKDQCSNFETFFVVVGFSTMSRTSL